MRGEYLRKILSPGEYSVADIDVPVAATSGIFRSAGWRYYLGPLVQNVSRFISNSMKRSDQFDLIWVDKGVFINSATVQELRSKAKNFVHYTPDCAFLGNMSRLFYNSIAYYDHCVTTKSFEIELYKQRGARKIHFCTQGYDPEVHFPRVKFEDKAGVLFVGLCEPSREDLIQYLIENDITVSVAGKKWEHFSRRNRNNSCLRYLGEGFFGDEYAKTISQHTISLGLLSKNFPELHTTRTFEIPACGTLLASEKNHEMINYFNDDEVIYYMDKKDLEVKIKNHLSNPPLIQNKLEKALNKLSILHVDYQSILVELLNKMDIR
jgi:hypothetical protein